MLLVLRVRGVGRPYSFVAQWRDAAAAQCATCIGIDYLQENQDTQNGYSKKTDIFQIILISLKHDQLASKEITQNY